MTLYLRRNYVMQIGAASSQLESTIWRELVNTYAVSTADIFNEAYQSGTDILILDSGNISEFINSLNVTASAKKDIQNSGTRYLYIGMKRSGWRN